MEKRAHGSSGQLEHPIARSPGSRIGLWTSVLLAVTALTGAGTALAADEQGVRRGAAEASLAWPRTTPDEAGFDTAALDELIETIAATPPQDFRALAVARGGKLVLERTFNSFGPNNLHDIRSAGKSVTSMLAGLASDQGLIDIEAAVPSYFPQRGIPQDSLLWRIRVQDVLTMSAGLAADDDDDDSPGTEDRMSAQSDYVAFILDLPMAFAPGERYAYSSAGAFLLGALVENAAGARLEDFAREHLFNPLGIYELYWQVSPQGRTTGMGNLYMTAADLAKLGQLMLDGGRWRGHPVLSKEWIEASLIKAHDIEAVDPFAHGYGFMWYLATIEGREVYFASGNGGNKLFVVPEEELVVVTLSSAYGTGRGHRRSHRIFEGVLAALKP